MIPTLIIAAGNPLAGDDGLGPAVADMLRRVPLPESIRIEDVHTDILALGRLWKNERRVWILDAMARGSEPGTIYRLGHEELLKLKQGHRHAHALSLTENLRWLLIGRPEMRQIRFRAWGVEAEIVGKGDRLNPKVAAAVPLLADEILGELWKSRPTGDSQRRLHGMSMSAG